MPSWAVKQRREHEGKGAEGKERTQALKAATTAGPLPGLTTKASKKSEREEEEENDAISMAVADSEERRARRLRHKEQRARVRANMMATAMVSMVMRSYTYQITVYNEYKRHLDADGHGGTQVARQQPAHHVGACDHQAGRAERQDHTRPAAPPHPAGHQDHHVTPQDL